MGEQEESTWSVNIMCDSFQVIKDLTSEQVTTNRIGCNKKRSVSLISMLCVRVDQFVDEKFLDYDMYKIDIYE